MFEKSLLFIFHAETPLHVGAGTAVSYVDLPIQREKHTSFPIMQASGVKGVIRDFAERRWKDGKKVDCIFGPENTERYFASCISFTDAKILLFPVRSLRGVFACLTCPFVLKRFIKDLKNADIPCRLDFNDIPIVEERNVFITDDSLIKIENNKIMIEEYDFEIMDKPINSKLKDTLEQFLPSSIIDFSKHFAIVHDNIFKDFVNLAIEIRTRIRIDQLKGIAKEGALFTEELVPAEAVFYSLCFINDPYFGIKREVYKKIREKYYEPYKAKNDLNEGWEKLQKDKEIMKEIKENIHCTNIEEAFRNQYFTASDIKEEICRIFGNNKKEDLLQFGGDETLGIGLMKVKIIEGR